jgi:hypothetical protein
MFRSIVRTLKNLVNDGIRILKIRSVIITKLKYEIFETKYKHTFFGYYDKNPFNVDSTKILAIATNHDDILTIPKIAVVGFFDTKSKEFTEVDETTTWCWQQGCRSMWFDEESFIYNKIVENDYGSVVYDTNKSKVVKSFNFPIYDKTSDNKFALSLNFSRLQHFRPGYGYCDFLKESDKKKVLIDDGIYLCDLEKNTKELIIPLSDIIKKDSNDSMNDAYHYINHLKFSPDNASFLFYHFWVKDNKRYTRAVLADIYGEIISILDNNSFMSHYAFKNLNNLLIYTKIEQEGYHLFNLNNGTSAIFCKRLRQDGHPTYLNKDTVLTDTYPNRFTREQHVILAKKDGYRSVAKIYSPVKYSGEFRCDLHPRTDANKTKVSIDIPTFNGRKLMVLSLNDA